jgi:hypothetical protein
VTGVTPAAFGSLSRALAEAQAHQFFALDVDTRTTWMPTPVPQAGVVRVRSAWVPGSIDGWLATRRRARLEAFLDHAAREMGLRTIVLPRSAEVRSGATLARELRARFGPQTQSGIRFALGVRGSLVPRGHDQLSQLSALRHQAEEWDFDLALDLAGEVPHYLEAEAAVLRLLPRLALVRVPSWVSPSGELNTGDPISRRVVAILADQGYAGTISIIPAPPLLPPIWSSTAPTASDEWTRSMILDRYDRQRADERPTPYISPELFREHY